MSYTYAYSGTEVPGGNGTAPTSSGSPGGRPTLDQIMFMGLQSNPAKMTVSRLFPSMSTVIVIDISPGQFSERLSSLWQLARSYLIPGGISSSSTREITSGCKSVLVLGLLPLGSFLIFDKKVVGFANDDSSHFGICIAQVSAYSKWYTLTRRTDEQAWELSRHAFTDFRTVHQFEAIGGNVSDLIGAFLNIAASSYYAFRAYRVRSSFFPASLWIAPCGTDK
jgi:hypothetical protein